MILMAAFRAVGRLLSPAAGKISLYRRHCSSNDNIKETPSTKIT